MNQRTRTIAISAAAAVLLVVVAVVVVLIGHHGGGKSTASGTSTSHSSAPSGPTSSGSGTTLPNKGPAIPSHGALFGAWAGTATLTQENRMAAVTSLQQRLGVNLSIVHLYRKLDQPIGTISDRQYVADGKTLLISWAGTDTIDIVDGSADATIEQRAREVGALNVPVFFEFRWEMDRPNLAGVVHGPTQFIAAWNHVRAIFAQEHVTNVSWVWCPTAAGFDAGRAAEYYPGDAAVDWICADGYAYPNQPDGPQSFASIFKNFLAWANTHQKPVMIGEFGIDASYAGKRTAWIAGISSTLKQNPDIKALVYFNDTGTTGHYSLNGDSAALKALARVAQNASTR